MKKYLVIAAALVFSVYVFGCGKKQATEESQEPMTMETMSAMTTTNAAVAPEAGAPIAKAEVKQAVTPAASAVNLPPSGSEKPSGKDIQTALKNAGYYAGDIDGKIGPKTKKAIEEFQKANNLKADGKVGPKTWALLSTHLNATTQSEPKKR